MTDRTGVITAIGTRNWNGFAFHNDAPELDAAVVIGESLLKYVSGIDVQQELRNTLQRLSTHPDCNWVLPFRCDSPELMREMRQSVRPIFSGEECSGFLFQSIELDNTRRPPINLFDFKMIERQRKEVKDLPILTMCSWCQRVKFEVNSSDWIDAETYYASGGKSSVQITHGICESCLTIVEIGNKCTYTGKN